MTAVVMIVVNSLALTRTVSPSQWLYVADIAYLAGNSIHAISLAVTKSGINVETQMQPQMSLQTQKPP